MPKFTDESNKPPLVEDGDYSFTVIRFDCGISTGAKTRGSDDYSLKLKLDPSGVHVEDLLIDHDATRWKMDCFLKCCGIKMAKGQDYTFKQDDADDGVPFINPIGLRGWCHVGIDVFKRQGDPPDKMSGKSNKVRIYYTDKEKLPRAEIEQPEDNDPFASESGVPF